MREKLLAIHARSVVAYGERSAAADGSDETAFEPFWSSWCSDGFLQSSDSASIVEIKLLIAILHKHVVVAGLTIAHLRLGSGRCTLPQYRLAVLTTSFEAWPERLHGVETARLNSLTDALDVVGDILAKGQGFLQRYALIS